MSAENISGENLISSMLQTRPRLWRETYFDKEKWALSDGEIAITIPISNEPLDDVTWRRIKAQFECSNYFEETRRNLKEILGYDIF